MIMNYNSAQRLETESNKNPYQDHPHIILHGHRAHDVNELHLSKCAQQNIVW